MSIHDRWRGARSGDGKRWEVRYRDGGIQRKKRFDTKQVAEAFDAKQKLDPDQRTAIAGRNLTVDDIMATWLQTKRALRPKALEAAEYDHREVLDTFAGRLASNLKPSEIRIWSARDRGYSQRRRGLTALMGAYRIAVADRLVRANPADGITVPTQAPAEQRYLTWEQLKALAEAAGDSAPCIWLLGTVGLRLGEMIGLQVGDVDVARKRIRVLRSVSDVGGRPTLGLPKHGKTREVSVSSSVLDALPISGRAKTEWLFVAEKGGRLRPNNWRREVFQDAAAKAGLGEITRKEVNGRTSRTYTGLHPHELRHTAVSLAVSEGSTVTAVARMLGHQDTSMIHRVYLHLWESDIDDVGDRMEAARARALGAGSHSVG